MQESQQLQRTMKTRHLVMLSLGGVIGTGLFFNTGYIISTTGAAGTLL
ncbi:MAG TPA: S-methylmethionine permease, partial [Franconibacter pulveris]|nr:S-methylmethionine permease [Franconibacter pulveris]